MVLWRCFLCLTLFYISTIVNANSQQSDSQANKAYKIEGKVTVSESLNAEKDWQIGCRILVNYGEYIGFVRRDGTFVVSGVLPGSYIVEIQHLIYAFESVRVDITSKGKFRARRLNLLQPSVVVALQYPLQLAATYRFSYFRARDEWHLIDILSNPMVLMMIAPLALLLIFPRLVNTNDPEIKKEMAKSMPQMDIPDVSDMLASWLGRNAKKNAKRTVASASSKKRN